MMVAPLPDSPNPVEIAEAAAADQTEPLALDTSVFQELLASLGDDLDMVVSIYRTFFGTAVNLIDSLSAQDCATQIRALHTLKGSAAMLGAERMARLAAHLQHVAPNSIHPLVKTRIDELTGELDLFRAALTAHARTLQFHSEL